ncbi:hypothetical protein FO519_008230 [Halicephalobus sp. NKZ332]|nr:hypothetical protein FO519_008230 [Halicephalobus sp. NKZ332]
MNFLQILCVFSVFLYSGAVVKRQSSNYYASSNPTASNQYSSQYGMNGQYGNQNGMNSQYSSQYGMNGQYGNQNGMNGQYSSQYGMNGQYGNQNGMNGQYSSQNGMNGQYGIDAIILTFSLPKLMGQLNPSDMASLNQTIARLQGASGNQIVPVVEQWVSQLNPTTQQQVQSWLQSQMAATQTAQQKGTQLINQNNVSTNVRNAWQQLQQLVMSMTVTSSQFGNQLNQIYNSLSSSDQSQFNQIFQQVYGYSFTQYFVPALNNQALQSLYQQYMGNGGYQSLSAYENGQSGYNSNMGYNSPYGNSNQMMYNQGSNVGYPYSAGANPAYGTQYSATGYAAPYTFNSAYGRRSAYKPPPMAPMMATP